MSNKFSMDDYIDVAERIMLFKEAHPEGSLQTLDWSVQEVGNRTFIVYRAAAFRTPDDERPGHGIAWEPFPGPTPYTKDSELMNAETAAWGRAIVALGLAANRKIASKQEVKARQQAPKAAPAAATPKPLQMSKVNQEKIRTAADNAGIGPAELANMVKVAAGGEPTLFETEDDGERWLGRWLPEQPVSLLAPVLASIEATQVAA